MKKTLLLIMGFLGLYGQNIAYSQTTTPFTVPYDTVYATVSGTGTPDDNITNTSVSGTAGLKLNWHVVATDFPLDWLAGSAFGICDNNECRNNNGDTVLWNPGTLSGPTYTTNAYYYDAANTFGLSLNLSGLSTGTHYVSVAITDAGAIYTDTVTFVINRVSTGVTNINNANNNVVLYPNPTSSDVNIVYGATADVKSIAVYNIIGKLMNVYKVTGNSANLSLGNMPSGIYFVRLFNSHGDVLATRKFTKQ